MGSKRDNDNIKAVLEPSGRTSNYFGGDKGKADGDYHGHVVADSNGNVTYERDSGERK